MKYVMVVVILLMPIKAIPAEVDNVQTKIVRDIMWAADKVGVPKLALLSICYTESHFKPTKKLTHMDGSTLSYGICQIKKSTAEYMDTVFKHKYHVTAKALEDYKINAFYAAKYFRYQLNRYDWNIDLAIDAYNKHNAISKNTKYTRAVKKHMKFLKEKFHAL